MATGSLVTAASATKAMKLSSKTDASLEVTAVDRVLAADKAGTLGSLEVMTAVMIIDPLSKFISIEYAAASELQHTWNKLA